MPLSSAETIARLLDHSLNAELYGDRAVTMLARVINGAESFELTGGSSAAASRAPASAALSKKAPPEGGAP